MDHKHDFVTWPFDEPTNTAAYTTSLVLDHQHPILLVSHDSEGDWQMLCGTTTDAADGRVVCLGCVFERDSSIGELADLPQGWLARRDQIESAWTREPNPDFDESAEWDDFSATAVEYLCTGQERLNTEFDLGNLERYDYDQEDGTIRFSSGGKVAVIGDMKVVGTTDQTSGTWLWSWQNESILSLCKHDLQAVRALGERHNFQRLVTDEWPANEEDGWEMTAVAAYVLGADGAYSVPYDNGAMFLVLQNLRREGTTD